MATCAQRELLHDVVERSRERVVHVRAGSSILHVLQQQQLQAPPQMHKSSSSLPLLPPAPTLAIATKRRGHIATNKPINVEPIDEHRERRQRNALPCLAKDDAQVPEAATSFEQYQNFMATKIYREKTMHLQNRRAALVPKADLLKKLATVCAAALKEMESQEDASEARESLQDKLLRAMALLRGGRAFANAKSLAPPLAPAHGEIKNAHLAFLEFKRDGVNATKQEQVHPSAGLQDGNTSTKTPIHFGDQICFLSSSSDLPLAVGSDGRSSPALDSSAGPHMIFTIVDFRNPSRNDEVTATDDFWLRVDPAVLAPRKSDARHVSKAGHGEVLGPTDEGGDEFASLLSDTNYYLGCPGWIDGGMTNTTPQQEPQTQNGSCQGGAAVNATTVGEPRLRGQKCFRIVAMRALTPSKEFYGDDAATREYAVETNEGIMRLARWRFVRYTPRRHEQAGFDNDQDVNDAMVNCSTVYLVLGDFALVYDKSFKRGVGVRVSSDEFELPSKVLKRNENGRKERKHHHTNKGVILNVAHLSACARWQVRILQRVGGINYLQELEIPIAAVTGDYQKVDGARVEWLREKQEKMARNDRRLHAKTRLVPDARRQYDLVAARSNSKLEQIERQKGAQATEYFRRRLQELEIVEGGHQPYEIMQLKQQQLNRVVELPRL